MVSMTISVSGDSLPDRRDRGEAGAARHVDVEDQDLGTMPADVAGGRVRVAGLGDDLDVGLPLEHQAQGAADDRVVVSEDDGDALSVSCPPVVATAVP